jgi:hypothetical protein
MGHAGNLPQAAITTDESKEPSSEELPLEYFPDGGFSAWATAFGG